MTVALNRIRLYTWDGLVGALEKGATEADFALPAGFDPTVQADAIAFADLLARCARPLPGGGEAEPRDRAPPRPRPAPAPTSEL